MTNVMMSHRPPVTVRMESLIQKWEAAADRRAIFLRCYLLMTQNVLAAVEGRAFRDCQWVNTLLHRFADYYFEALSAYEEDEDGAPAVWSQTHNVARQEGVQVVQHLLLGVNAHINYDLVMTLVELLEPEWSRLSPQEREMRYADHCQVNDIIGATVDAVQDEVIETAAPGMNVVDILLGPVDEWLISHVIKRWRDEVWDHALKMLARSDTHQRERIRFDIETLTQKRAQIILLESGAGAAS